MVALDSLYSLPFLPSTKAETLNAVSTLLNFPQAFAFTEKYRNNPSNNPSSLSLQESLI